MAKIITIGGFAYQSPRPTVPSFDDQDDLPVAWAFIRESYRWRPVSSGGKLDDEHEKCSSLT